MIDDDDFSDFDDLEVNFDGDTDDDVGGPDLRATVVNGRVTVIPWMPALVTSGPMTSLLWERERAGVTIVDLTRTDEGRELVVRVLAGGGGRRAERALERWAAAAGYGRLWFPRRVAELAPTDAGVYATTACTNCGAAYRENTAEFWATVRNGGMFPGMCPLCGGDMPQWRVGRRS